MSIKVMSWVWQQHVTQAQKLVLMALADHADDEGVCWPGVQGIAQKCDLSRRMVQRHLKTLEGTGFLQRTSRKRDDGSQASNLIRLTIPKVSPLGELDVTPPVTQLLHPSESPLESSCSGELVQDHHNLLSLFSVAEQLELQGKYPTLDFEVESQKCVLWWIEGNKTMKRPRTAFLNWLEKAAFIKANGNGYRNSGRGMTPGAPPSDRNEYLRDYERRRMA